MTDSKFWGLGCFPSSSVPKFSASISSLLTTFVLLASQEWECIFKLLAYLNCWPQCKQENGFSVVWDLMWEISECRIEKIRLHPGYVQANNTRLDGLRHFGTGLQSRLYVQITFISHKVHVAIKWVDTHFLRWWFLKVSLLLKVDPHRSQENCDLELFSLLVCWPRVWINLGFASLFVTISVLVDGAMQLQHWNKVNKCNSVLHSLSLNYLFLSRCAFRNPSVVSLTPHFGQR